MPSTSGWGLRRGSFLFSRLDDMCFYALDVGLGFATLLEAQLDLCPLGFYALDVGLGFATCWASWSSSSPTRAVSMPSTSGWGMRRYEPQLPGENPRFYALDVGLGFATEGSHRRHSQRPGFYALDVGLGFAT